MTKPTEAELFCPSIGQPCILGKPVDQRTFTLRRWTGGNVKATTCSLGCAERWAKNKGYIATGVSEKHSGGGVSESIVIVQHPDQVHASIKKAKR